MRRRPAEARIAAIAERPKADFAEQARHAVYGSVIVLAVIVVLDNTGTTARQALASIIGASLATVLAELYADYLGATIRNGRRPTAAEERTSIRNTAAGFLAAIVPSVFFILAVIDAIELDTAFTIATWSGLGILGTYAFAANRLAGLPIVSSILAGTAFVSLGAIVIAIKALAH